MGQAEGEVNSGTINTAIPATNETELERQRNALSTSMH